MRARNKVVRVTRPVNELMTLWVTGKGGGVGHVQRDGLHEGGDMNANNEGKEAR